MQSLSSFLPTTIAIKKTEYRSRRDEIVKTACADINKLRPVGMKQETPSVLARRINCNPFLKSDTELELLVSDCRKKGSFTKLYWVLKQK